MRSEKGSTSAGAQLCWPSPGERVSLVPAESAAEKKNSEWKLLSLLPLLLYRFNCLAFSALFDNNLINLTHSFFMQHIKGGKSCL